MSGWLGGGGSGSDVGGDAMGQLDGSNGEVRCPQLPKTGGGVLVSDELERGLGGIIGEDVQWRNPTLQDKIQAGWPKAIPG